MATPSLSIVIPAYNESSRIERTLRDVHAYLSSQDYPWEIILVDDGSTDRTADIAHAFAITQPGITVVTIPHAGKAAAVLHGIRIATGDLILFSDADLATPLSYVQTFRELAIDGADVVIGSREGAGAIRVGEPFHRHYMGRAFNGIVRTLLLPGVQDTQCGFKLFRQDAISKILPYLTLYRGSDQVMEGPRVTAFDVELLVAARRQRLKVISVPVVWTYGEQSKVHALGDSVHNLRDILTVKFRDMGGRYH